MAKKSTNNFKQKTLLFLKGLISNEAVINMSKTSKWWAGLIVALVSSFIPVIPIMVSNSQQTGSSFLSANTNGFETYLLETSLDLADNGHDFKVNDEHLLEWTTNGTVNPSNSNYETPLADYVSTRSYMDENGTQKVYSQIEFEVYYVSEKYNDTNKVVQNFIKKLESSEHSYFLRTTDHYVQTEGEETPLVYAPSYTVLFKDGIYTSIKTLDSDKTLAYTAYTSNWKHTKVGTELIKNSLTVKGVDDADKLDTNPAYVEGVLKNWKAYYNQAFITQRDFNVGYSALIFTGIYIVLIFAMGLMLFLLTRGKKNMFNYLTFFDTQKMAWWSAFAPGVLSLIIGFMFSNYAMMLFILFLGMRTMWMSMRQLRPAM